MKCRTLKWSFKKLNNYEIVEDTKSSSCEGNM